MFTEDRLKDLLKRYATNQASEIEIAEMLHALREKEGEVALESVMKQLFDEGEQSSTEVPVEWEEVWSNIKKRTEVPVRRMSWARVAAAAMVVLLLSVAGYFYFNKNTSQPSDLAKTENPGEKDDAEPGGNKAVLILADGTQIVLDSAGNGTLGQQGNTKIIKLNNGQLSYNAANSKTGEVLYNTISTPKGGQYQVELADGSKVWLNAASSLRFPTSFPGNERKVQVSGEAYFEVAKNPAQPFVVSSMPLDPQAQRGVEVMVLGTHFNVNAYDDEAGIKVSLLEGSVKVAPLVAGNGQQSRQIPGDTKMLQPGEQAVLDDQNAIQINEASMDDVIAWRNGYFSFNDADIQSVMRQLARWYDVEIKYEGKIPDRHFQGKMERNLKLSEVLHIIETNNVHFKIKDKTLVVNP